MLQPDNVGINIHRHLYLSVIPLYSIDIALQVVVILYHKDKYTIFSFRVSIDC